MSDGWSEELVADITVTTPFEPVVVMKDGCDEGFVEETGTTVTAPFESVVVIKEDWDIGITVG
jgi:hypothetical protein